ncbi:RNA-protein complex protein Nop10 [Candidatus Bathyarchaeota archaeon]|nr:MAG: RNA-protein complex protein Nop10 [Candidatus Bathyarchaeota archaeon]
MVWLLRKCVKCSAYTLRQDRCPYCGGEVRVPHPAKFSLNDRFEKYRIKARRSFVEER